MANTVRIHSKPCPGCGKQSTFVITVAEYNAWQQGKLMQKAFPNMPAADRETLITGYCGPCWDKLFNSVEDSLEELRRKRANDR